MVYVCGPGALGEYCEVFGKDMRTAKKLLNARQRPLPDTSADTCDAYVRSVKKRGDAVHPLVEDHGRKWWLDKASLREKGIANEGSQKNARGRIKGQDKSAESVDKEFLSKSLPQLHSDWLHDLAIDLPHLKDQAVGVKVWSQWRCFWHRSVTERRVSSCGCSHCLSERELEKAVRIGRHRHGMHAAKPGGKRKRPQCVYDGNCRCACFICNMSESDTEKSYLELAMCSKEQKALPNLACVLQKCSKCGIARVLNCPEEADLGNYIQVKAKKYVKVTMTIPGQEERTTLKLKSIQQAFTQWVMDLKDLMPFTLLHQYLEKRIQREYGSMVREHLMGVDDTEAWIMDFIENFSCFDQSELYMDHYNHEQVTIFVILVLRQRREGEELPPGTATFRLPEHMTCELHAFISEDRKHDAGFFQKCVLLLLNQRKDAGTLPRKLIWWTDGGPAHFKMFRNLDFLAAIALVFNLVIWWCFFQSAHGRGMQDGGGNWLKSAAALLVLSGVSIQDAFEFYAVAMEHLLENKSDANFTNRRFFYFVTVTEAMSHRAAMPAEVTSNSYLKGTKTDPAGWFFFASGPGEHKVWQRRCVCFCPACQEEQFNECLLQQDDTVDGEWWNKPFISTLKVSTKLKGANLKESKAYMKKLRSGAVVAIKGEVDGGTRAGSNNTSRAHSSIAPGGNSAAHDSYAATAIGAVVDAKEKFWLGVVVAPVETVKVKQKLVLGKKIMADDIYIIIQWLDRCGDGLYELTDIRECIWEIESIIPIAKLGTHKHTGRNEEGVEEDLSHIPPFKLQPKLEAEIHSYVNL